MEIVSGWKFLSADFSILAAGGNTPGRVTLVRSPEDRVRWHQMTEEQKEDENGPELYVYGRGLTFEEALREANENAVKAKPINT